MSKLNDLLELEGLESENDMFDEAQRSVQFGICNPACRSAQV